MMFEFDSAKSEKNKAKHGLDFNEAQLLWEDPDAIGFPARSDDEERFALLAVLKGRVWIAFYTLREDRIRLISVRKARKEERRLYES
jgi:uncharacterized DUF497 family protein